MGKTALGAAGIAGRCPYFHHHAKAQLDVEQHFHHVRRRCALQRPDAVAEFVGFGDYGAYLDVVHRQRLKSRVERPATRADDPYLVPFGTLPYFPLFPDLPAALVSVVRGGSGIRGCAGTGPCPRRLALSLQR